MYKFRKFVCFLAAVLFAATVQAQSATAEGEDFMRSNGKIYVVVAVVLAIVIGLLAYVYSLDRKISKLEKKS
jgi:CcmD family protein